ncbi:hypothetical protein ACHAWX_005190 [Stephanocyclus meneghinianus]
MCLKNDSNEPVLKPLADASPSRSKASSTGHGVKKPPTKTWYNQGGIQGVTEIGMGFNVVATPVLFLTCLSPDDKESPFWGDWSFQHVFMAVLVFHMTTAYFVHQMRTLFCVFCVSMYMTSLLIVFTLDVRVEYITLAVLALAAWRVAVCMSVCLHRYAAHAAFKCGPTMQIILNLMGCAANQGGPIWWASQHRCHHKYCEMPRDPHSALQVGTEKAFSFFLTSPAVEEEFAPRHNDNWYLRLIDTWSFLVVVAELFAYYTFFGREGLFVSYTSLWICECITLWFNIANHPANAPGEVCKASSVRSRPKEWYPAFQMFHILHPILGFFAGEIGHDDHHDHPMLAKRDSTDLGYYLFILPLSVCGLVWDVKTKRL